MPIKKRASLSGNQSNDNQPKKPLRNIKKRRTKPMVYTDQGVLVVKTPAACTNWPQDFRLRVVKEYTPPRLMKGMQEHQRQYHDKGYDEAVYNVQGHRVMVKQPADVLSHSGHVIVLRTEVVELDRGEAMFLYHSDPAMRILMVYAFLEQRTIPGVPKFDVYPYTASTDKT